MEFVGVQRGVLLGGAGDAFVHLLQHVRGDLRQVAPQRRFHHLAHGKLHLLGGGVEVAQLRRQVETLLDQQVFNRILQGALALGDKRLEIFRAEWGTQQDVERRRRDEV